MKKNLEYVGKHRERRVYEVDVSKIESLLASGDWVEVGNVMIQSVDEDVKPKKVKKPVYDELSE